MKKFQKILFTFKIKTTFLRFILLLLSFFNFKIQEKLKNFQKHSKNYFKNYPCICKEFIFNFLKFFEKFLLKIIPKFLPFSLLSSRFFSHFFITFLKLFHEKIDCSIRNFKKLGESFQKKVTIFL